MKRYIALFCMAILAIGTCLATDHIILRNGQESDVKLSQITNDKIIFRYVGDKNGIQHEVPSKDVYMVYIEKQGNIYITADGKRLSGEYKRADTKKYDIIYLIRGAEIPAENIRITENAIRYTVRSKATGISGLMGKDIVNDARFDKSEVFMIRYRSGITDIITPIEINESSTTDTSTDENPQQEYVVIFHAVAEGENLEKIAARYNVTPEQILEWNELPSSLKPTYSLTVGMQLMIYQPKQ